MTDELQIELEKSILVDLSQFGVFESSSLFFIGKYLKVQVIKKWKLSSVYFVLLSLICIKCYSSVSVVLS